MPVTWCYDLEEGMQYCSTGFPMGCYKPDKHDNNLCATILRVRLNYYITILTIIFKIKT